LQQRELLIFNTNKKLLKKLFVPLRERGIETLPYCIENEKLYQLIETENDGDEAWKLYITDIQ